MQKGKGHTEEDEDSEGDLRFSLNCWHDYKVWEGYQKREKKENRKSRSGGAQGLTLGSSTLSSRLRERTLPWGLV